MDEDLSLDGLDLLDEGKFANDDPLGSLFVFNLPEDTDEVYFEDVRDGKLIQLMYPFFNRDRLKAKVFFSHLGHAGDFKVYIKRTESVESQWMESVEAKDNEFESLKAELEALKVRVGFLEAANAFKINFPKQWEPYQSPYINWKM